MPPNKDATPFTNKEIDFVIAQRARGVPHRIIAIQTGRDVDSIDNAVRRYALPPMKVKDARNELSVRLPDDLFEALRAKLEPERIPYSTYLRQLVEKDLRGV